MLFGATGDLAKRKLLPGMFHLAVAGLMPDRYRIVATCPTDGAPGVEAFKDHVRDAIAEFGTDKPVGADWRSFESALLYAPCDTTDATPLTTAVQEAESEIAGPCERLFHLAVPPVAFAPVVEMLGSSGLADRGSVIIEKPFGEDLASARALNDAVRRVFDEPHVFRIDHFVGKESVDNILAFRFANGLFEPVWNREHIAYVQIDVPEKLTVEGRASFYERTGAFRDMVVTHLMQVLGFVAMEPPVALTAKALREERQKVFDSMLPLDPSHAVRGQYVGYRSEPGVAPDSQTETFIALRVAVENWRWAGVPFHLRTGKCLAEGRQVITIGFRQPTLRMFPEARSGEAIRHNKINIDFSDPGSITARFLAKQPGPEMRLGPATMVFNYEDSFLASYELEGYERLILEAMLGMQEFFSSADQVERLWEVSAPLLENPPLMQPYAKGSWGPDSIDKIAAPYHWHLPEKH